MLKKKKKKFVIGQKAERGITDSPVKSGRGQKAERGITDSHVKSGRGQNVERGFTGSLC